MDRVSTVNLLPETFNGVVVRDDITGQIGLIWDQIRAPLIVPLLKLLTVVCLTMSVMLFIERVYMGVVIVFLKLFGRKPEKRYKWEPIRDDVELGNSAYPMVLIQIPMFNEKEVYQLSIGAACGLSWPSDRIVIQVLDDSTDPTVKDLVELECQRWASKGINIKYEIRDNRNGYKAGALKEGMKHSYVKQCEYIAIFDADFQPEPDFLWRTIPFLVHNPDIGLVQARWKFVNSDECLMTRMQEMSLDYHFTVEQEVGSGTYAFFGFNGTAGVWRIAAINEAGGWKDRTTVEDMDLAVRASLKGWKFLYVGNLQVKNELPSTFKAYRYQQHRWSCGPANLFRKMVMDIIRNKRVTLWKKLYVIYSFFFVRKIIAHIVTFLFYCVVIPMTVFVPEVQVPKWGAVYIPCIITLLNAVGTPRSLHLLVFWILFENVMSLHRTKATFIGLLEAGRVNEWVVTEKLGDALKAKPTAKAAKKPRGLRFGDRLNLLELCFGVFLFFCACYDVAFGKSHFFIYLYLQSLAFFIMGFGYVGNHDAEYDENLIENLQPMNTITDEMGAEMTKQVNRDEIIETLAVIDSSKAPGPDGFSALFFKVTCVLWAMILSEQLGTFQKLQVAGYQIMVLEILSSSISANCSVNWPRPLDESLKSQIVEIHVPDGVDLSQNTEYASQAALWGIEGLPELGEIYPLGGSGDRLGLVDPDTGECLPAAMLPFCGRTLLEGLIRDLQAREFLYFKIHGRQCVTPVAIMTSSAKNNHERIMSLCETLSWFGRGRSSFQLFEQPLVPAVSAEDGQWLVRQPFSPVCKPGGHGVIWKLAHDKGIFQWFYGHGRKGATVRQVSNVVAATDVTLLALAGSGLRYGKKLGFASCKRKNGATEGINVLMEKRGLDGNWAYGLSCIEYTEFDKFDIAEEHVTTCRLQENFPANTNILYVDLASAEKVGSSKDASCLPGMVLNLKKLITYVDHHGFKHSVPGGRLECTMQSIADNFLKAYSSRCYNSIEDDLDTYIVYNERQRVTSSAKRKRKIVDKSLRQTPDGALLDIIRNASDILSHCDIKIPKIENNEKYCHSGPPFLIFLHPALGPLWEVTRQKFHGGYISKGSELQIEVAEFLWKNVQLDGTLIVSAENVMGSTRLDQNDEPILHYGYRSARCKLQNVKVLNKGIDWNFPENNYWKADVQRFEEVKIILHGNAEFEATNVILEGNHVFEVPDGHKLLVNATNTGLSVKLTTIKKEKLETGSWSWKYNLKGTHIDLEMVEC